ncbi:uncharacterized protein LOC120629388 [Pararge aegeria]|uniref:uncharacterized protein LOC120629388 n=1 Tax=Pararge aegeria TaxID=116150 RepID=UPI0019D1304C|nr:uncharacterized protein LOC120629388 [Pararge aegeria]
MEYCGRRNRRGRPRSRTSNQQMPTHLVQRPPQCSVFNSFCSFLLLTSLIAIIYIMLDYHCKICSKKCDVDSITKSINDIGLNISRLKDSYTDLEKSIQKFSEDIPKIEGQIEILETLANTMEKGDFVWNPKTDLPLPNVGVILKEPRLKFSGKPGVKANITEKQFKAPVC